MTARRICFVTTELQGVTFGGIGAAVASLAQALHEDGWDVTVLLAGTGAAALGAIDRSALDPRLGRIVGTDDAEFADVGRPVPDWAYGHELTAIADRVGRVLERLAADRPFDVVEFPDYQGLGALALRRRQLMGGPLTGSAVTVRVHGTLETCMEQDLTPVRTAAQRVTFLLEREALALADRVIVASDDVGAAYRARYGFGSERLLISALPYVPVVALPPRQHGDERVVVFIGKSQRLKGVDRFTEAAARLIAESPHRWRFVAVGDDTIDQRTGGSVQDALTRRLTPSIRGRIEFTGQLTRPAIEQILAGADLVVFPNRVETYCLAAYEVAPTGLPAVLSDIPAFDAVARVRDELGLATRRFSGEGGDLASAIASASDLERRPCSIDPSPLVDAIPAAYAALVGTASSVEDGLTRPLVSVIVPYYEMQEYIDATVSSILASTYERLEVIVVDDGSPSADAREAIDKLAAATAVDGRVRFLRKENGGLGSARNAGIAEARGDYILPVDSDDLVAPQMIERMVVAMERTPEISAVSCYVHLFEDDASLEPVDYVVPYNLDPVLITIENRAGVASSMFRRSVFEHLSYDEWLWSFEDWDLWWSLAERRLRAAVLPEALFYYRRRPGSMVKGVTPQSWARLMEHIADRHPRLLTEHAVGVYGLVMSSFVVARAAAADGGGRASPDPSQLQAYYREIVALRSGRAARVTTAARQVGRRLRRPHRPASFRVVITPRADSDGRIEVWFAGVRPRGSSAYLLPATGPEWQTRPLEHPLLDRALVTESPAASLQLRSSGDAVALAFLRHGYTTAVQIDVGGVSHRVELTPVGEGSDFVEFTVGRDGSLSSGPIVAPLG